jgi:RNA polymerase sigma factor (sigma-70 family)
VSSDDGELLNILKQHGAQLHALLTRLTLRAGVAEDLLQELFLKLREADGFASAANRKAYVFQTAIHLAFDWRRRQRPTESLCEEPTIVSAAALDRLIDAEEMEQVLEAMRQLSELGRHVLVGRYLQFQDYGEIALELGKTEHQVRGLCHKALGQLRLILRPAGEPNQQGAEP